MSFYYWKLRLHQDHHEKAQMQKLKRPKLEKKKEDFRPYLQFYWATLALQERAISEQL